MWACSVSWPLNVKQFVIDETLVLVQFCQHKCSFPPRREPIQIWLLILQLDDLAPKIPTRLNLHCLSHVPRQYVTKPIPTCVGSAIFNNAIDPNFGPSKLHHYHGHNKICLISISKFSLHFYIYTISHVAMDEWTPMCVLTTYFLM